MGWKSAIFKPSRNVWECMPELPEAILTAVQRFNQHRSPEATAEVIGLENNVLCVRFTGTFCATCGWADYFEDLAFELDPSGPISLVVIDFEEESGESYRVRYRVMSQQRRCARR
jgi:hypothetical protein